MLPARENWLAYWWNIGVCHLYVQPFRCNVYCTLRVSSPEGWGWAKSKPFWKRIHFEWKLPNIIELLEKYSDEHRSWGESHLWRFTWGKYWVLIIWKDDMGYIDVKGRYVKPPKLQIIFPRKPSVNWRLLQDLKIAFRKKKFNYQSKRKDHK